MEIQFHGKALGIWLDVLAAIKAETQPWKKVAIFKRKQAMEVSWNGGYL